VFLHGTDGVRTEFDTEKLLSTFARDPQDQIGQHDLQQDR
jgi:hypothetical protein